MSSSHAPGVSDGEQPQQPQPPEPEGSAAAADDGAHAPTLTGDRVVLRPWRSSDREALDFDESARTYVGPSLPGTDDEGFEQWLATQRTEGQAGSQIHWCIADAQTDEPMGWISLMEIHPAYHHGSAEVAYWMLPAARGKGALSQALALVRDYAFGSEGPGLHRLWAMADHRNAASQGVLRKAGYRWSGTERRAMVYQEGGPQYDVVRFELLAAAPDQHLEGGAPAELVVLEDSRIRLRPWRHADAPRVQEACQDEDTKRWLNMPDPYTGVDAERYISDCQQAQVRQRWAYCVADVDTDECVASVDVTLDVCPDSVGSGEIGYWTHPAVRGQGIMPAALRLLQQYAFTPVAGGGGGLTRLNLQAADANDASRRVARKAGFTEVGRDRAAKRLPDGSIVDHVRYDLLAEEITLPT